MVWNELGQEIPEDAIDGEEKCLQNEDGAPNGGNHEQAGQKVAF
jgi:hypothetical protein